MKPGDRFTFRSFLPPFTPRQVERNGQTVEFVRQGLRHLVVVRFADGSEANVLEQELHREGGE